VKRRIALATCLAVALTACTGSEAVPPQGAGLTAFADCDAFLSHVQDQAAELVTSAGLPDRPERPDDTDGYVDDDAVPAAGFGANLQVAGVDEPDLVASDGRILYALASDAVRIVDVTAPQPRVLATIEAVPVGRGGGAFARTWDARLLLHEDRLLVLSTTFGVLPFAGEQPVADVIPPAGGWARSTVATLIDVSDPAAPQVRERLTVEGAAVTARRIDEVAVLTIAVPPANLPWRRANRVDDTAEQAALDANRDLVRTSTADDWLPRYEHETSAGERTSGALVACDQVARPPSFAGLGTLVVLPVDLGGDAGLTPDAGAAALLTAGDAAYATDDALYVTTERWDDPSATDLHAFGLTDPGAVDHLGSGTVPGTVPGSWAMSEHEGVLRVASTLGEPSWEEPTDVESLVTTLRLHNGSLVQLGQVTGLGPDERITAVRFTGDVGYLSTAFASDPFITLDLSDPADPRAVGQLKLPGVTAYLHPLDDDLLLGVGQATAASDDESWSPAAQLSLFDVADLAAPRRLDERTFEDTSSEVEDDHRALLHWEPTGLTVVPTVRVTIDPVTRQGIERDTAALAVTATRDGGLEELRLLTHSDLLPEVTDETDGDEVWERSVRSTIRRSRVLDERLVTVSDVGVKVHDLTTLEDLGGVRFDG
jgi:hypothetical protein